jgi:hypothetical protein
MWALLMDGQQQGWSKFGCICTKVTGTEAGSGRELGKILSKTYNTSEAQFWLNAGGSS